MRQSRIKASVLLVFFLLAFLLTAASVNAHHRTRILGESTSAAELVFPPVTAGPGFILPDSPLFFLDQAFQSIRLTLAFNAQRKAEIRNQIAGERLAELRLMLSRNEPKGIDVALTQLTSEMELASENLSDAAASGANVRELAKLLNQTIKMHREILGKVASQSTGALKLELKAARTALKDAKIEIEDELPEDELENEIEDALEDEIDDELEEASESARGLEHAIDVLTRLASQAAVRQQTRREEALRHAIEVKNEALIKQQKRLLKEEKEKREELIDANEAAVRQAKKTVEEARETAEKFEETKRIKSEIRSETQSESSGSSSSSGSSTSSGSNDLEDRSGSSGSSGSGSGSSGSGSSGSGSSGED